MEPSELQALQDPAKARYRAEPEAALFTLTARGELDSEAATCSVDVGRQLVEVGLHPATGGDGTFGCSGDMLLQALVACAGVTMRSVAINRGLSVTGSVTAEGVLDFRGTLGVDRDAPVGFISIDLNFDLQSDASADEIAALLRATERYCVVYQTLCAGTPVAVTAAVG